MDLIEFPERQLDQRHPWEQARCDLYLDALVRNTDVQAFTTVLDVGAGDAWLLDSSPRGSRQNASSAGIPVTRPNSWPRGHPRGAQDPGAGRAALAEGIAAGVDPARTELVGALRRAPAVAGTCP
jgi:hypothetical protein